MLWGHDILGRKEAPHSGPARSLEPRSPYDVPRTASPRDWLRLSVAHSANDSESGRRPLMHDHASRWVHGTSRRFMRRVGTRLGIGDWGRRMRSVLIAHSRLVVHPQYLTDEASCLGCGGGSSIPRPGLPGRSAR